LSITRSTAFFILPVVWSSFPSFFKPLIIRRNEAQRGCDPYDNFEFTCGKGSSNIHCVSESATRFEAGISRLRLFGFRIRCLSRPALQLTLNRCVDTEAAYPAAVMNSSNSLSPLRRTIHDLGTRMSISCTAVQFANSCCIWPRVFIAMTRIFVDRSLTV